MQFYLRVKALLRPDMTAVDFGAGRGHWYVDSDSQTRTKMRDMRGSVARVIGLDVDPVVAENPTLDESHVIKPDAALPLGDESVDIIVSDFTFEHIDDPAHVAAEFDRILRPGGWICARTPSKWGYIGVGGRIVPNRLHVSWLKRLQPGRKDIDVFPVRYQLNTRRGLRRFFPPSGYEHVVYTMPGEPSYAGSSRLTWRLVGGLQRLQPRALEPMLLIFLRKRAVS